MPTTELNTKSAPFTVCKIEFGVAILLSGDHELVEYPLSLLPADIALNSTVLVSVDSGETDKFDTERREKLLSLVRTIRKEYVIDDAVIGKLEGAL